jgi:hypothetical protein
VIGSQAVGETAAGQPQADLIVLQARGPNGMRFDTSRIGPAWVHANMN